ncbi:hypothetical protein AV530_010075 [Patagioenas fasciata monilis]|uniref:Agmatinase, mitochondrial n=1 Tax=Patagioenas fasciata monilis TaxID=372326 RepID=A0A1V4K4S5_PATFA|nr:hypothetical protein AV530_010075 [Patagioenas fasciata monilis]
MFPSLQQEQKCLCWVLSLSLQGKCSWCTEAIVEQRISKLGGFRVVPAEQCWGKSLAPLLREVRAQMGDKPLYISFDIDGLDPAYAPGTGTPEIAGLTPAQALEIIRGCKGLNIVGWPVHRGDGAWPFMDWGFSPFMAVFPPF